MITLTSNKKQLKQNSESLPIVSENEKVQKNSMRLYTYLVCLSHFMGRNVPRRFNQTEFNLNQIRTMLHMDYKTIKKYWKVLEESDLVKYHGPAAEYGQSWDEAFMKRKKYTMGYYELSKERTQYRIIPRETVDKIISKYYRVETKKNNNFNEQISYFVIEKVNYYTDGGEAGSLLEDKDGVIPQSIKDNLLNEAPVVNFE